MNLQRLLLPLAMGDYHRLSAYLHEVSLRSEDIHLLSPPSPSSSSSSLSPAKICLRFFKCTREYVFDALDQEFEESPQNLPVLFPDLRVDSGIVENGGESFYRCVCRSLEKLEVDDESLATIAAGVITKISGLKQEQIVSHPNFRVLPLSVKIIRVDFLSLSESITELEMRINASIAEGGEADEEMGEADNGMVPASEKSIKKMVKRVTVTGVEVQEESEVEECAGGGKRRRISRSRKAEACMICLEAMGVGSRATQLPCTHLFHIKCAKDWLRTSHYCPLCRFEFPTDGTN